MLERKHLDLDEVLNKISLIVTSLRFASAEKEGSRLGALLELLSGDLEDCLLALDDTTGK